MQTTPTLLLAAAEALAQRNGLTERLQVLVVAIAEAADAGSAAVFVLRPDSGHLAIEASIGVGDPAALEAAAARPGHPIARALADPGPSFDVEPTAAGGPALRSHLPMIVRRRGQAVTLGVLALAHDRPISEELRPLLAAAADLLAVAMELERAAP